jgi:hypothetical protein
MAADHDLEELAAELAEFAEPFREAERSHLEERVLAGFEDIQQWVIEHGHRPEHGEGRDIFERLYAVRLDRIRELAELRALVEPLDHQGLLRGDAVYSDAAALSDDELAAELQGIGEAVSDLTALRHVRPRAEIEAADEIASRKPCADFAKFKPLFEKLQQEIQTGARKARPFGRDAIISLGDFFIVGGQFAYIAEMGEIFRTPEGAPQARMRVIYGNGTESNLLIRSLQNALYKDPAGRRVTQPNAGPLFADPADADR